MKIDALVLRLSHLKCKLVLLDTFDEKRFKQAYTNATDLLIYKTGNINDLVAEYEHFKSLVS